MVTKVSQILPSDVAEYIRVDEDPILETLLEVAKNYVKNYTGLDDLDEYNDLVIVIYILVQDMYDNRAMYVDSANLNTTVQTILNLHTRNNV